MSTNWNLSQCAATALDVHAVRFSVNFLNVLLGPSKDTLWSSNWLQRESGILALGPWPKAALTLSSLISPVGAVSDQYPERLQAVGLLDNLLDARPIRQLDDSPLFRGAQVTYFIPTMEGLLRVVLDNNKHV